MLFVWYIWSRCFWFITNEIAPWPFVRSRLYRIFYTFIFTNLFTYNQLNVLQRTVVNLFYIDVYFWPMSDNFVDHYYFTLNRNYFSPKGYKFISYEGLVQHTGDCLANLEDFSTEAFLVKQSNLMNVADFFELLVLLRYYSINYYLAYFVYYLKSFYEIEPLNFKNISTISVYLATILSYTSRDTIKTFTIYDLNKTFSFAMYLRNSLNPKVFVVSRRAPSGVNIEPFLISYYERLIKMKAKYIAAYKHLHVNKFFFHNTELNKVLIWRFQNSSYANINSRWLSLLRRKLFIRFSDSSITKYINFNTINNYKIYYIRKNRIFNKGRYSRNRQLYRTGVFWCLWLNVIVVYGLYFFFYRFTFNFGYLWIGIIFLTFSFIFARVCQARLYDIRILLNEFLCFWEWARILFENLYIWIYNSYLSLFYKYIYLVYSNLVFTKFLPSFYASPLYDMFLFFSEETRKIKSVRFVFYWEYFIGEDNSFLKWKSKAHWFKQVWKMLVT